MKKALIIGGIVAIVGVGVVWVFGRPAYQHHRENRAMKQARAFMAKKEYRNASLSAGQALQSNPQNEEACRIKAEVAERARLPQALDWRRKAAEAAPTIDNRLKVASTSLQFQNRPYPLAAQILEELGPAAQNVPGYHVVSAELALKLNDPAKAASHFEAASRLEPTNQLHQLNLAVLRLQSTNADASAAARVTLERLRTDPEIGNVALRWLITESIRTRDLAVAEKFSQELLANRQSVPDDRLQHLSILEQAKSPDAANYLREVQSRAATNAAQAYSVSAWLIARGMADRALTWLTNLPADIRAEQPVPLAIVDCCLAQKDWRDLQNFLETQKWGELEYLRFAFLSRAASEQKEYLGADARWRTAVKEAGGRIGALTSLLNLAATWGREKAREDLLWDIIQRFPRERWTLHELQRLYEVTQNTRGLNKLAAAKLSYDSRDFRAQNDFAGTALLLHLNLPRAHEVAKELFTQHPEEPMIAATYAFSLHLQGRTKEGLALLEKLKPADRDSTPIVLYYGLLLNAADKTSEAKKYLEMVKPERLLPEERALLAEAKKEA